MSKIPELYGSYPGDSVASRPVSSGRMLVSSLTYMPRFRAFISDWRRSTRRSTSALFLVYFIEVLPMPRGLDGLLDDVRSRGFQSPSLGGVGFIIICCAFFIRQVP